MIQRLEVTHYPRGPGNYTTVSFDNPCWETIFHELQTMDRYEKPILTLEQDVDDPGADLMMVNGGNDLFHIQIADSYARWYGAIDPSGSDELVDVWTSDQGFTCDRKRTWPLKAAAILIEYYFRTGKPHPDFHWE